MPAVPAEHDADWELKKSKLGVKMMKLRGMLGQLRQAASSERQPCARALRLVDAASSCWNTLAERVPHPAWR